MRVLHPLKIRILKVLLNGEKLTIYGLSRRLKVPWQNLAWHVKSLRDAGLLKEEYINGKRFFSVNEEKVKIIGRVLYITI